MIVSLAYQRYTCTYMRSVNKIIFIGVWRNLFATLSSLGTADVCNADVAEISALSLKFCGYFV